MFLDHHSRLGSFLRPWLGRIAGIALSFVSSVGLLGAAPATEWIWHPNDGKGPADGEVRYFRKAFTLDGPVRKATLTAAADNHFVAYVNGQKVGAGDDWAAPVKMDVKGALRAGANLVALQARNDGGAAALLVRLNVELEGGGKVVLSSDTTWEAAAQPKDDWMNAAAEKAGWVAARSHGKLGVDPWGDVLSGTRASSGSNRSGQATAADQLTTLADFQVALLHSATAEEGSWICMAIDPKGRLIISPQNAQQPLWRFTIAADGSIARREAISLGIGEAMGMLHAFDSLYVNGRGPQGTGIYRLRDTDGDDQYDTATFLKTMQGGGEHGPHGLALGPDNHLYVMNGNHTKVPDPLEPSSPHSHYEEDQLLPRDWDGNGHARGILAPGGYIARTDADGKRWELMLGGYRNAYDLAMNDEGEIFTFDSDMEWDWGMPWYRPTAIYHSVSGADFGWRSGTGKWPWYYPDALPPVAEVGLGSPTGVLFGRGAKFPAKYQKALYAMDWSYGRIIAAHLTPAGASYTAELEPFVVGRPLNVSDMVVGHDGALYFTTGGRGTQSGLYRVRYTGAAATTPVRLTDEAGREARELRRRLESFHGRRDPAALDFAWPHLDSPDRFIRYAARVAVESQPVHEWQQRALDETRTDASLTALLALARHGSPDVQEPIFESLRRLWPDRLNRNQQLDAIRVAGLSFIRLGKPSYDTVQEILYAIEGHYPTPDPVLNMELCRVLVYLEAPSVIEKTLDLLEKAPTQEEQIHYIVALRTLARGWTLDQRKRYFSWYNRDRAGLLHPPELGQWFQDVGRTYTDGASFPKFLENFKKEAMQTLPEAEKEALADILAGRARTPLPEVAPRAFVKEWTMEELQPSLDQVGRGRSLAKGREAFLGAQCVACHKFGNEGGAVGQELTAVASRYTRLDILDSILHPSKIVSEQYQYTTYYLKDGEEVTGKVIDETDGKLVILVDPIHNTTVQVEKKAIQSSAASKLSPMPEGLLNVLAKEEILDLLAFLESGIKQ